MARLTVAVLALALLACTYAAPAYSTDSDRAVFDSGSKRGVESGGAQISSSGGSHGSPHGFASIDADYGSVSKGPGGLRSRRWSSSASASASASASSSGRGASAAAAAAAAASAGGGGSAAAAAAAAAASAGR